MVFRPSGKVAEYTAPPGIPEPETPIHPADDRTTRAIMLNIERLLLTLVAALDEDEEQGESGKTLDGGYAGKERDQTESLG